MALGPHSGDAAPAAGQSEPAEWLATAAAVLNGCGEVLLAEPEPRSLAVLAEATEQLLDLCPPGALRDALLALRDHLEDLRAPEDLVPDYRRLFGGPHRLLAPPWESVYLSESKLVMQEQTRQVRTAYLEAGLAHEGLGQIPDDHIGLEVQFVGALLQRAVSSSTRGDHISAAADLQAAREFFEQHPRRWLGQLAERVSHGSTAAFYPALLKVTAEVLDQVCEARGG